MSSGALSAVEAALERGDEPDDVLRETVAALAAEPGVTWAGIAFWEEDALVLGPQAGAPDDSLRTRVSVLFDGDPVGELLVDGHADRELLEAIAPLIAPHVLIGWDTGGEPWEP